VISGHLGWVRSLAVEPGNKWFVSGAGDRVIKVWDLASGELRLSLTGHISTVRGLAVSARHPYLFSCGEDKVKSRSNSRNATNTTNPTFNLFLDGQMLGPRGEQGHQTLPRPFIWCLFFKPSSYPGCPCNSGPGCFRSGLGYADKSANPRSLRPHRYSGRC
jgi:WD40 repeat protein